MLCLKFLPTPAFRVAAVECLAEIATLPCDMKYHNRMVQVFVGIMTQLVAMIPIGTPIPALFTRGTDEDRSFIHRLALFFTALFTVRSSSCVSVRVSSLS